MPDRPPTFTLTAVREVAVAELTGPWRAGDPRCAEAIRRIQAHAALYDGRLALGLEEIDPDPAASGALREIQGRSPKLGTGCTVAYGLEQGPPITAAQAATRDMAVDLCLREAPPRQISPRPPRPLVPRGDPRTPRLAVLISGGGRTLVNLQERITAGSLRAGIGLVLASRACAGVARAGSLQLPTRTLDHRLIRQTLGELALEHAIDLIVLAGYLHLVDVPPMCAGRIVNIHPALLPAHAGRGMYGLRVHEDVLRAGDKLSGCTVHFVDASYDTGPHILQRRCPVFSDDTPQSLADRVFALECEAYPEALNLVLHGETGEPRGAKITP